MQEVSLGERLFENSGSSPELLAKYGSGKSFPLIPMFESKGIATYRCPCQRQSVHPYWHNMVDVVVQIRRGVVADVKPWTEGYELTTGPKNPEKARRRDAAWQEACFRAQEERVKRLGTTDPMRLMADAFASPLRRELLYSSVFRSPSRPQFLQMAKERLKGLRGISDLLKPTRGRAIVVERLSEEEAAQL
jgi:hypothetical protein